MKCVAIKLQTEVLKMDLILFVLDARREQGTYHLNLVV